QRALEEKADELKKINKVLSDNEKLLSYEATKYKAQALGLEKLCEEYRKQIANLVNQK
ncbi:MAG: hypothetical protein HQL27_07615, partial [Candidatus Omnitrophica bacterium]|nr:hypothetical protein [Candidatus Omnitrophota bacterium]